MKTRLNFVIHICIFVLFLPFNKGYSQLTSQDTREEVISIDSVSDHRIFQISFLPFITINQVSINSAVDISLNILAGVVGEVRALEVGGVLNIDRNDAGKCQLAGVGNIVGGQSQGLQAAGVVNIARSMKGIQSGGVVNIVEGNAGFCQLAGVGNLNGGSFTGFQGAGVLNIADSVKGVQTSGVLNIINAEAGECQIAGVGNLVGGSFQGLQAAGVFNISEDLKGVQVAGILNSARNVSGTQISGLINTASVVKGFQLSVFNFADSCDGIPFGVMSFVKKNGYRKVDVSIDELFITNLSFRTGIRDFHTFLFAGIRPDNFNSPLWTFGYGLGTTLGGERKIAYDIDISSQSLIKGHLSTMADQLCKLYFGIDTRVFSNTSIAAGLTYNLFITDTYANRYSEELSTVAPYTFSNHTYSNGINIQTWIGGKIALRWNL